MPACTRATTPAKLLEVHETVHQRLGRRRRALRPVLAPQLRRLGLQPRCQRRRRRSSVTARWPRRWCSSRRRCCNDAARRCSASTGPPSTRIAHIHGPGTTYHAAEIASFWRTFDADLPRRGQPRHALSVHRRPRPRLCRCARARSISTSASRSWPTACPISPTGNPIYPNGSPRDVFLHVRPERKARRWRLLHRELR